MKCKDGQVKNHRGGCRDRIIKPRNRLITLKLDSTEIDGMTDTQRDRYMRLFNRYHRELNYNQHRAHKLAIAVINGSKIYGLSR